jgi:hypothetical protein
VQDERDGMGMFIKVGGSSVSGLCDKGEFSGVVVFHDFEEGSRGARVSATRAGWELQIAEDGVPSNASVAQKEIEDVDAAVNNVMDKVLEVREIAEQMVVNAKKGTALEIAAEIVERRRKEEQVRRARKEEERRMKRSFDVSPERFKGALRGAVSKISSVRQVWGGRSIGPLRFGATPADLGEFPARRPMTSGEEETSKMFAALTRIEEEKDQASAKMLREQKRSESSGSLNTEATSVMKLGELRPKVRPSSASSRLSEVSHTEIKPVEGRQVRSVTYAAGDSEAEEGEELVRYIGEVDEHGMRHGIGTLWFRDGSIYEGEFERDQPHGVGIET